MTGIQRYPIMSKSSRSLPELKSSEYWPPLFKLKRGSKEAFCLGVCHRLTLSALPASYLDIIARAKFLVTESTYKLTEQILLEQRVLLEKDDERWFGGGFSSASVHILFVKYAMKFFNKFNINNFRISKINQDLAYWVYYFANRPDDFMDEALVAQFQMRELKTYGLEGPERYEILSTITMPLKKLEEKLKKDQEVPFSEENYLSGKEVTEYKMPPINLGAQRNLYWLDKLINYFDLLDGPGLFAVGAAHLGGATGLLELLRNYGFEVTRVNLSGISEVYPSLPSYADSPLLKNISDQVDEYAIKAIEANTHLPEKFNRLISKYLGPTLFQQPPRFLSQHIELKQTPSGSSVHIK